MWKPLILPLMAANALAQSSTTATTASATALSGIPTTVTYLNYGTTIIYLSTDSATATASESVNSTSAAGGTPIMGTRSIGGTTATSSAATATSTALCNGYAEFCNRKYSNITMVAAHNSPFDIANNVASNQDYGVIAQLNDGVRLVQGQVHMVDSVPYLCHTSCDLLNAGLLELWLANITEWLDANPYEVVTVLIGNGDYSPVTAYTSALEASGINSLAYVPSQIPMNLTSWPTLGEMIITGKRAVIFMDYDADQTEVEYVLDEFSQMSETPFDPTDASFPCTIQRPPGISDTEVQERLYMINHNLNTEITLLSLDIDVPNTTNIAYTNGLTGYTSAGLAANNCITMWDRPPNFINVDYYNRGYPYNGSVLEVAAEHNGVTYDASNCCGKSQSVTSAAMMLAPHSGTLAIAVAAALGFLSLI